MENYLDVRKFGHDFNCQRLSEAVERFIRKNFSEYSRTEAFLALDLSETKALLMRNDIEAGSEEEVLVAALKWCQHNDKVDCFITELSECVRFRLLSVKYLAYVLKDHDVVMSNKAISNYVLDQIQSMEQCLTSSQPRHAPEFCVAMPFRSKSFFHLSFPGEGANIVSKSFPDMICNHIKTMRHYAICKIGDSRLYLAGGIGKRQDHYENNDSIKGFMYDLHLDTWTESENLYRPTGDFSNAGVLR